MKKFFFILVLLGALALIGVCSAVTFLGGNAKDFAFEQQPTAKSWGDLIGRQYSQLRDLAASLDSTSCKLEQNVTFRQELVDIYGPAPEAEWPSDARAESRAYRQERTALTQVFNNVVADYNVLRSDVRTIADNLGLEVDFIPEVKEFGVGAYPCGSLLIPK